MSKSSIAQRYAKALFDFTHEHKTSEQVYKDIVSLIDFLSSSTELQDFLNNPTFSKNEQINVLRNVFKSRVNQHVFIFLIFLIDKKRINALSDIFREFVNIYVEEINTIRAKIVSHVELTDKQVNDITSQLHKKYNKDIQTDLEVDASMLGGFRIQVKDAIFDHSIRYKLSQFQDALIHV